MGDKDGDDDVERLLAEEDERVTKKSESSKNEMVIRTIPEQTPYQMMDRADEEQILAELNGLPDDVLDTMVYSFPSGGKRITGLSWVGTKTLIVEAGNYAIEDPHIVETADAFRVVCRARDLTRNIALYGAAEVPKRMKTRDGEIEDPFALSKALSKAQRNALQNLLPKKLVAEFITKCMAAKGPKVRFQ
ncbi:Uncharacterised protein [uncultured archaeon]|nr:Uncharacterised protein [uncultured archaeon]